MTMKFMSMAAVVLLATTSLCAAQDAKNAGTTIVPAGQSAPQTSAPAAAPDAPSAPATPAAPAASQAPAGDASTAAGDAKAPAAAAEASAAGSGDKKMSDVASMKVDKSPSADTKAEGNAPTVGDVGKPVDPAGNPTYDITADGTADWYTWRGYKKFGANCLQCHGPDGMGSSFAPNLTDQLQNINYFDFAGIVVGGQQNKWNPSGNSIMPAWGEDPNVMCSMDAIYIYLRARADGVVGRGEPKRPGQDRHHAGRPEGGIRLPRVLIRCAR